MNNLKPIRYYYIPSVLILITVILFFIQKLAVENLSHTYTFYYPVWKIYVFHFLVTFFILTSLFFVGKKMPDYIGFTFLGFILLKMVAAIVFLIPLIKLESGSKIPDFISFFIPYFIYLFIEIILTMKLLKLYIKE